MKRATKNPRQMQSRHLLVLIATSTKEHCSNDCDYMVSYPYDEARCRIFNEALKWDTSRKLDGYKRCESCKGSEQ